MKERPILMSGPMVRAILAGTKTQTRRVVKPQPADHALLPSEWGKVFKRRATPDMYGNDGTLCGNVPMADGTSGELRCPYGQPGDSLWVREAWRTTPLFDEKPPRDLPTWAPLRYEADETLRGAWAGYGYGRDAKLRPGMFMPSWASRINLEVTGVRVERLQEISRGDAMDEGCPFPNMANGPDPRKWYAELWERINGAGAWDANPWVWVIEFRRL